SERGILAWATTTGQICLCVPSEASQRQAVEPMQSLNLFASSAPDSVQGVSLEEVVQAFAEIFADPQKCVVGFDLKPWFLLCIAQEIPRPRAFFDVMLAAYVLKPGRRDQELSTLALEFLRRQKTEPEALLGKGRKKRKWSEIESGQRDAFVAEELDLAMRLYTCVAQEVEERGYPSLLEELEFPLLEVLAQMEARGVALDLSLLKGLESELTQRVDELSAQVAAYAPEPEFNVNSPQQVAALLFEHLKLHEQYGVKVKKTKKGGRYSTDQEVLEQLSVHPLACLILEVRELQKLLSTYITALPTQVKLDAQECARIHTSFRQAHTATGRLSSMNPNLQNIPIRTERGRAIRKAFVPGPAGWQMLSADYSQVELRLLAHVSEDPTLMEAFQQGVDIHTKTAASIFECSSQEVTPTQRSAAKAINFGIIYGMGPPRLAKEIDVSVDEAGRFIKAYFRSYPKVREYLDRTIEEAKRQGYVETLLGRRRWIQDIHSSNAKLRAAAYNIAVNTPIQGSAADLIKRAMLAIDRRLQEAQMQAKMLLQIHDELLFEVPPEETEPLQVLLRQEMEGAMQLKVPLVVEVGCGQHWADAH
ncbi:MAG: DNA polymerase I, partial [Myxococcota bacterium]